MIFALLFVLLIFLLIEYRLFFHYVLHPAIIVTGVFFLSTFFSAANYSSWGDISGTTFGVILVAILLFCIGCICGDTIVVKKNKKSCNYAKLSNFFIPKGITVMIIIFMAIITALDFNDVRSVSQVNSMGIVDAVMNARNLLYTGETSISHTFLIQQGLYISRMVAYVYIFIIYYQRIIMSIRPRIINYIPIVLYFIQAFLSTGRTEFMYIIYAWLLIGYLIKLRKNSGRRNVDIKYSGKILLALGIFLIIFLLIANMRKSDSVDMFSTLSIYIGSPINALDYYITENGLPRIGAYGAAIASVIAETIGAVIQIVYCIKTKQLELKKIVLPSWRYYLSGSIMFGILLYVKGKVPSDIVGLAILLAVGISIYMLCVLLLRDEFIINNIFKNIKKRYLKK